MVATDICTYATHVRAYRRELDVRQQRELVTDYIGVTHSDGAGSVPSLLGLLPVPDQECDALPRRCVQGPSRVVASDHVPRLAARREGEGETLVENTGELRLRVRRIPSGTPSPFAVHLGQHGEGFSQVVTNGSPV